MSQAQKITIYEPDNSLRRGYRYLLPDIYAELKANRWLIVQLFKRDFFALYKQSVMGLLWAVIIPLVTVATFVLLSRSGVFNVGSIPIPYALYAVLGTAIWQIFSAGFVASTNSLVTAGPMITKINFSKKSLVIASMGQSLLSFCIQVCILAVLFVYFGFLPKIGILFIPVLIIPLILLTLGLGFILSLLNGVVRDIGSVLPVFVTFLLFVTPILYATPQEGVLSIIAYYNPLYYLVAIPRDFALIGSVSSWAGYVLSSVLAVVVFILCI
ncbi:MAG: ABC transporter permease, partial [Halobacteriota archaeon]